MQVVILAGGMGSRLSEETIKIPKPMVTIGDIPILLHIMTHYASYGHDVFLIALGYKGHVIKEYFRDLNFRNSNLSINFATNKLKFTEKSKDLAWKVELIDTGLSTPTAGRILNLEKKLENEFFLTYGDGVSNVDLDALLAHHQKSRKLCTITAVRPPARFGSLIIEDSSVTNFSEKNPQDVGWINGGFFCMSKDVLKMIDSPDVSLESTPMTNLVNARELSAYQHHGFWQGMDTIRDREVLENLWKSGRAPWLRS